MMLLVWLAIGTFAVWLLSVVHLGSWRELHHEWYGVALICFTVVFGWPQWLAWVGLAVMVDDAGQHLVQLAWPNARSPLHLLYRYTLYRWLHR